VLAKEERREGQQAADDGDGHAHREVVGAPDGEQPAVDVLDERAVDDAPVGERPRLLVVDDPVGDATLVPVGDAVAEEDKPGQEGQESDAGHQGTTSSLSGTQAGRDRSPDGVDGSGRSDAAIRATDQWWL